MNPSLLSLFYKRNMLNLTKSKCVKVFREYFKLFALSCFLRDVCKGDICTSFMKTLMKMKEIFKEFAIFDKNKLQSFSEVSVPSVKIIYLIYLSFSVKLQWRIEINVTLPTKCWGWWPISDLQGRKCCPEEKTYAWSMDHSCSL